MAGGAKEKLSTQIARKIVRRIIRAGWPVGENLGTEPQLMAFYGVSREPLREALRILEHQGVVKMRQGASGGLVVTEPAEAAIANLIRSYLEFSAITFTQVREARGIIKRYALELAMRRIGRPEIAQLRTLVEAARIELDADPANAPDFWRMLAWIEPHSGNPSLFVFDSALRGIVRDFSRLRHLARRPLRVRLAETLPYFEHLCDDLERGDLVRAQATIDEYLNHVTRALSYPKTVEGSIWHAPYLEEAVNETIVDLDRPKKKGAALANRIMADLRQRDAPVGTFIGTESELLARYRFSRAILRESIRMLEFFGVVRSRRGKGGGLTLSVPDPTSTIEAVQSYLEFARFETGPLEATRHRLELESIRLAVARMTAGEREELIKLRELVGVAVTDSEFATASELLYRRVMQQSKNHALDLFTNALYVICRDRRTGLRADVDRESLRRRTRATLVRFASAIVDSDANAAVELWGRQRQITDSHFGP
ncbi:MAG: FadR/GntR family transcriptional regulator [Gammaproteobacteria bacterium]